MLVPLFVAALWALAAGSSARHVPDLLDFSLTEIQLALSNGSLTSVELTTAYLARIAEVNDLLHPVIQINPDALDVARRADELRANGTVLSPLHGIPILLKDNIATADSMNTTAGSYALANAKVASDSTVAGKLRRAGAVFLGKSNLSQWANYRSTDSSNGWSAVGGQTFGAYHRAQDPSGSSSGSGVAASLGLCAAALGTETSGSIISPAQINNIVGIKPTVGLTSRRLVVPISSHQDTVGPMARTVLDAAHVLQIIAGADPIDNATSTSPYANGTLPDYVAACRIDGLRDAKIGIPFQLVPHTLPPYILQSFNSAVKLTRRLGATITNVTIPSWPEFSDENNNNSTIVLNIDFVHDLPQYFTQLQVNPQNVTDLQSLLEYTIADPREKYPSRNVATWKQALGRNFSIDSAEGQEALRQNQRIGGADGILAALDSFDGDVLMVPSIESPGLPALAGYPVITIPLGFAPANTTVEYNTRNSAVTAGPYIPYGISFIGRKWSEETLIRIGYAFEQATQVRRKRKPLIVPQTQISDVRGYSTSFRKRATWPRSAL